MRKADSIGFSVDLCMFFAEQDRILTNYFRSETLISYGEFILMCAMHEAKRPMAVEPLASMLMLRVRTVRNMLLGLEDRHFVTKSVNSEDGRLMGASLTAEGRLNVEEAASEVYRLVKESFWDALPESDFEGILKIDMRSTVNDIRGFAVDPFGGSPNMDLPIEVDHFIFWRVVSDRWADAVRSEQELSLNEFCVLSYLGERDRMGSSEIADALLLPRSAFSLCKRHLVERGLVTQLREEGDGRRVMVECTAKGKRVGMALFAKLDDMTRDMHSGMGEEHIDIVKAWYPRMFGNMHRRRRRP